MGSISMAIYSIYKFTNLVNGKVYIGKTVQTPEDRLARHLRSVRENSQALIHKAITKYGIGQFTFAVIFNTFLEEDLNHFEELFIDEYQCCIQHDRNQGYNMTIGGDGFDSGRATALALQRVQDGTHHFAGELGTQWNNKRIANGTHPFVGEVASARSSKVQLNRLDKGIHQFQTKEFLEDCSNRAVAQFEDGTHNFQKPEIIAKRTATQIANRAKPGYVSPSKGCCWIIHPETKLRRMVQPNDLSTYLVQGYIKGRTL